MTRTADDVGREHVGGELDPLERKAEGPRECSREVRLRDPRDAFDQDVSLDGKRDRERPDDRPRPDHFARYGVLEAA